MSNPENAVLRFLNGTIVKGVLKNFAPHHEEVILEEQETKKLHIYNIHELKAIFFVKSFTGNPAKNEKKKYGISKQRGNRVFIKFKDKEHLVGFVEGDVPWEHGYFLSKGETELKGFFLLPADLDSNNTKVFVVVSSIEDVTVVPQV
jgi:hypothetical protein